MKLAIKPLLIELYAYLSVGTLIVIGLEFLSKEVLTLLEVVPCSAPQIFIPAGVIQKIGLFNLAKILIIPSKYLFSGSIGGINLPTV